MFQIIVSRRRMSWPLPPQQQQTQNLIQTAHIMLTKCAGRKVAPKYHCKPPKFQGFRVSFANKGLLERKLSRQFTHDYLANFGLDQIGKVKLIMETKENPARYLDERKRYQLSTLYMSALSELVAGEKALKGILITKIEVPPVLQSIKILWRCTGDVERDQEIENLLREYESTLRKQMGELFFHTPIPPLNFTPDRQHLQDEEMNRLFEIADYGQQYRTVSRVGIVLGSTSDTGEKPTDPDDPAVGKEQTPPRWLDNWRRRLKASQANDKH